MGSLALRVLQEECSKRAGAADVCDYLLRVHFRSRDAKHRPRRDGGGLRAAESVLKDGLEIAGRRFVFLAYTDTQLKSASAWFIRTDAPITRAEILGRGDGGGGLLGDFHQLSPGMWAARVAKTSRRPWKGTVATLRAAEGRDDIVNDDGQLHRRRRHHLTRPDVRCRTAIGPSTRCRRRCKFEWAATKAWWSSTQTMLLEGVGVHTKIPAQIRFGLQSH